MMNDFCHGVRLRPASGRGATAPPHFGALLSSDTMYSFISLRKSTPPQSRQLDILMSNSAQQVENLWGF